MGIEMGAFTLGTKENLFSIVQLPTMPYEKDDNVWLSISLERNLNKKELSRTIYTGFDFLSDIGGLVDTLFIIMAVFVNLWNYNALYNNLVSKIYDIKPASTIDGQQERSIPFRPDRLPYCAIWLLSFL